MSEQLKINDNIIFGRKHFVKDAILVVGRDITEVEAAILKGMGKEVSVVGAGEAAVGLFTVEEVDDLLASLTDENKAFTKRIADLEVANKDLTEERDNLTRENMALNVELEALKSSRGKKGGPAPDARQIGATQQSNENKEATI